MNAIQQTITQRASGLRRSVGFSLVEVLLSIGILGVGMSMVAAIFPVAAKAAADSSNTALGMIMADNALATAKAYLSGGERASGNVTVAGTPSTWGTSYQVTQMTLQCPTTWVVDQWTGSFLDIYDGTAKGQSGRIVAMTVGTTGSTVVTVMGVFNPMPAVNDKFRIIQPRAAADSGVTSAANTSLPPFVQDYNKLWSANQWIGWYCHVPIFTTSPLGKISTPYVNPVHSNNLTTVLVGASSALGFAGNQYQFILLADDNTNTTVIHPDLLRYPSRLANTDTSRGCILMTTKAMIGAETGGPLANFSSANGATIVVVAYNKSNRANKVEWGIVMVTAIDNANAAGPLVTIGSTPTGLRPGALCKGSPLVFVETGGVAKIVRKLTATTALLDGPMTLPRGVAPAGALVVQEVPRRTTTPPAADNVAGPFTGTPLPNSPAIGWKVTQTGSR